MVDSVDLIVLGAFFGSGAKAGVFSSFLMASRDDESRGGGWRVVCKLSNGFSNARLAELHEVLAKGSNGAAPLMTRLDAGASLPPWMPPSAAKGAQRPSYVLSAPPAAGGGIVWEVKGTEFTSKAPGESISIRFPRLVRERLDKGSEDVTSTSELRKLLALGDNGQKKNGVLSIPCLAQGTAGAAVAAGSSTSRGAAGAVGHRVGASGHVPSIDASGGETEEEEVNEDGPSAGGKGDEAQAAVAEAAAVVDTTKAAATAAAAGSAATEAAPCPPRDSRPLCKFGANCYRRNPDHRREFRHDGPAAPPAAARVGIHGVGATTKRKRLGTRDDDEEDDEEDEDDRRFIVGSDDEEDDDSDGGWRPAALMPSRLRRRTTRPQKYTDIDEETDDDDGASEEMNVSSSAQVGGGGASGGAADTNGAEIAEMAETDDEQTADDADTDPDEPMATALSEQMDGQGRHDSGGDDVPAAGAGSVYVGAHGDDSTDEDEPPPAVRLPSPPSAAVLAPPVQPSPVVGLAASRTASGADWQVLLGGSFKSYDDTVQAVIESAWAADEEEVEVQVRGSAYVILLRETPMIQQVKGDTSRWRKVRRAPK